jgi:hypothetical protein
MPTAGFREGNLKGCGPTEQLSLVTNITMPVHTEVFIEPIKETQASGARKIKKRMTGGSVRFLAGEIYWLFV